MLNLIEFHQLFLRLKLIIHRCAKCMSREDSGKGELVQIALTVSEAEHV